MKSILKRLATPFTPSPVIIVSGLPRTGTSLMMNILMSGGVELLTDNARAADPDNPKGYFELEAVKSMGEGDLDWLADAQGKAVKIVTAHLQHLPRTFHYKIIIMERFMSEILASQSVMVKRQTTQNATEDDGNLENEYRKHLRQTFGWIDGQKNIDFIKVSYNQLLANPRPLIDKVNAFLGGQLDTDAMLKVIDPKLYRQQAERPNDETAGA